MAGAPLILSSLFSFFSSLFPVYTWWMGFWHCQRQDDGAKNRADSVQNGGPPDVRLSFFVFRGKVTPGTSEAFGFLTLSTGGMKIDIFYMWTHDKRVLRESLTVVPPVVALLIVSGGVVFSIANTLLTKKIIQNPSKYIKYERVHVGHSQYGETETRQF